MPLSREKPPFHPLDSGAVTGSAGGEKGAQYIGEGFP
jgi:hypothetical protein